MRIEVISPSPGIKLIPPCINPDSQSPTPLEDAIISFGGIGRKLSMTALPDAPDTLLLAYEERNEIVAFGFAPRSELVRHYGTYQPLNEAVYRYADMDRTTPDQLWFERRNRAAGIKWCKGVGRYEVPPAAIVPLTLSYAFSTNGHVRFEHSFAENDAYQAQSIIKFTLSFLGSEDTEGWEEEHFIPASRLLAHNRRRRKAVGLPEQVELGIAQLE